MPYFHENILLIDAEIDDWIVTTLRYSLLAPLSKTYSGLMPRELCTYSAITLTPSLVNQAQRASRSAYPVVSKAL
jgi:hypothetical protein